MSELVRLEGLRKVYGSTVALEAVDLTVREGEFLTLLGPSGSGKTTMLNLISGMLNPSAGRILIKGKDVTGLPSWQRGLGMVFQNYALFPHMTIFDNVAFPLRLRGVPKAEIQRRVDEVLRLVRLPEVMHRRPKELSGGQQQRVAIARCLVYDPPLILMDEPLGALDKKLREQMQLEIKRLHRALGITVVYVTHDQEEALTMSDRICVMRAGRIAQIGDPNELYFRPETKYVADFLGESNFFPARVEASGAVARLSGPGGASVEIAADAGFPIGTQVSVMVRPESFRVAEPGRRMNCLTGAIDDIVFVGGTTSLSVRLDDELCVRVKMLTGVQMPFQLGQPISISFAAEAAKIFPMDSE